MLYTTPLDWTSEGLKFRLAWKPLCQWSKCAPGILLLAGIRGTLVPMFLLLSPRGVIKYQVCRETDTGVISSWTVDVEEHGGCGIQNCHTLEYCIRRNRHRHRHRISEIYGCRLCTCTVSAAYAGSALLLSLACIVNVRCKKKCWTR